MGNFYKRLSYSFGNEDWVTEQDALQLKAEDRVIAVTASGDRPLNLLVSDCKEIISVDANPFQTALFDLKRAAMQRLSYEDYLAFLGINECKNRLKTLSKLESLMDENSARCWRSHKNKISRGVIYEGVMEKLCKKVAFFAGLYHGSNIQHLFTFKDLSQQTAFVEGPFKFKSWKKMFELAGHPFFLRIVLNDPGMYKELDSAISPPEYLYGRMEKSLKKFLASENIIASLVLQGKVEERGFSPYLTKEGFETIRKRADKIIPKTANIISYLEEAPENHFDAFSMSDIASYMKEQDFHRLCRAIYKAAKPGARFCIRQLMSSHTFAPEIAPCFERDEALEKRLDEQDRCFVYRFRVGTIKK